MRRSRLAFPDAHFQHLWPSQGHNALPASTNCLALKQMLRVAQKREDVCQDTLRQAACTDPYLSKSAMGTMQTLDMLQAGMLTKGALRQGVHSPLRCLVQQHQQWEGASSF